MKIKILFLMLFIAGVVASMAVAKPPPGKGNPHKDGSGAPAVGSTSGSTSTSTSTSTGTTTTTPSKKMLICHRTGNGGYVLISVSVHSAHARGKHKGDVPAAGGKCPSPRATTTTGTTGTTGTTTTTG
jgi:hypothetical protein